jgi:choice-of-anchor A domain-containing protein
MSLPFTASQLRRGAAAVALVVPLLVATLPAHAAVLTAEDILTQFNAVVSNNFSTQHDVEGRLVAGNINNGGSSTFYENPNSSSAPSTFQAVNANTISSCSSCNVDHGGSVNFTNTNSGTFGGAPVQKNNPSFAMSDFTRPLNALQAKLAGMIANSTFASPDNNSLVFHVAPDASGTAVFDMTAAQLEGGPGDNYNISFSTESATTIIINVSGSFTQGGGENFNGDTYLNEHVIWNFEDAANVNIKSWHGAVLAGDASVTNSSPMEGFLYAKNFTGGGELHDFPFDGTLPGAVPEPSTWAMMAIGFAGLGFLGFRRRSAATA